MARLEELTPGAQVRGLFGDRLVRVVAVHWHGSGALTLAYVVGGAAVLPAGLLARLIAAAQGASDGRAARAAAVEAILAAEATLGHTPSPVPSASQGYDVESRTAAGAYCFILVRHRDPGGGTFTVTATEFGVARNTGGRHVLALVDGGRPRYLPAGLATVPDPPFDTAVVTLPWQAFYDRGQEPR